MGSVFSPAEMAVLKLKMQTWWKTSLFFNNQKLSSSGTREISLLHLQAGLSVTF